MSQNCIDVQWIHPERCVSTHCSRTGTIDLERADARTKDLAAFSPGNAASSVTIANLRPALWSSAAVTIKATQKDKSSKREECSKDGRKAKSKNHVVFLPGKSASSLSKQIPVLLWGDKRPFPLRAFKDPVCSSCVCGLSTSKTSNLLVSFLLRTVHQRQDRPKTRSGCGRLPESPSSRTTWRMRQRDVVGSRLNQPFSTGAQNRLNCYTLAVSYWMVVRANLHVSHVMFESGCSPSRMEKNRQNFYKLPRPPLENFAEV